MNNENLGQKILFNSRSTEYKSPFGCLPKGEDHMITLTVKIEKSIEPYEVFVRFYHGQDIVFAQELYLTGEDIKGNNVLYNNYSCVVKDIEVGLYFYSFDFISCGEKYFIKRDELNQPCLASEYEGKRWQVTCYAQKYEIDQSFAGRVMYQIFPDRFCEDINAHKHIDLGQKLKPFWVHEDKADTPAYLPDELGEILNNDFYGGNFVGIMSKLDYIKSMGVGVIYLNPICLANSNHRYDTSDYKRMDPMLGTAEEFIQLVNEAHDRDIKIILDCVFSHTGSRSVYFDINNEFSVSTNQNSDSIISQGAYHNKHSRYREWYAFDENTNKYDCWWGIKTLPNLKELNVDFLDFLLYDKDSVIEYYFNFGIDGIRLDVADELPDQFLQLLYNRVKEINPKSLIIGEVWEDASNKVSYGEVRRYFLGNQLESVMNYVFKDNIIGFIKGRITPKVLNENILTIVENYPCEVINNVMNILSTHDTARILTALLGKEAAELSKQEQAVERVSVGDIERQMDLLTIAVFLQFMLPGMPCIYYGDEIGMQGYGDPFNRRYFNEEDKNVSIFKLYKTLANIRLISKAVRYGKLLPFYTSEQVYSFVREYEGKRVLCVVNRSSEEVILNCNAILQIYTSGVIMENDRLILNAYSCGVFELA